MQDYNKKAIDRMRPIQEALRVATAECLIDMHEPDNQNISAVVSGYHLNNAMGNDPNYNCGEFTVGIVQSDEFGNRSYTWFNLADLIAIARAGVLEGSVDGDKSAPAVVAGT